jgi:hypothetical protein
LAQGLQGGVPPTTAHTSDTEGSDLPDLIATFQILKMQMKDLNSKLASVALEKGKHCVRFGNAGFRNPRDVIPSIKAQMPRSYFRCFVNAAILLEWLLGNSGDETLKNMKRMHKLKIPSLAEVHSLKGLECGALPRLLGVSLVVLDIFQRNQM